MSTSQPRVKRGKAFSIEEDEALCVAWLTISQDPVTGNAQKENTFWNRVFEHFSDHTTGKETRTACSIQNRWDKIRLFCTKYRGCLAQAMHRQQSGFGLADQVNQAKELYENDIGKPFVYDHCWEILKETDKWVILSPPINRTHAESPDLSQIPETPISLDSDRDPVSTDSVSSPRGKSKRPPGQKATKEARRKGKASPSGSEVSETIERLADRRELRKNLFDEKKLEIMHSSAQLEITRLQILREKEQRKKAAQDMEQQKADDAIMQLDTSGMSPTLQQYYQIRKDAIMAKALNVGANSNFNIDYLLEY